jgi:hypothetical protein
LIEVDRAPSEARQIAEALTEIQTEKHQTTPFHVVTAGYQNAFDFRQRERAPCGFVTRFKKLHAHSRIDCEQSLPCSFAETYPQHLHAEIGGRPCALFRLAITKPRNVACLQRGKVAFALRVTEKAGEAFNDSLVTSVRGFLCFDGLRFEPCVAPRFDGRARQRFHVCCREHVADALRDHFASGIDTQLSGACLQRGLVPRAADFQRLLPIARFR